MQQRQPKDLQGSGIFCSMRTLELGGTRHVLFTVNTSALKNVGAAEAKLLVKFRLAYDSMLPLHQSQQKQVETIVVELPVVSEADFDAACKSPLNAASALKVDVQLNRLSAAKCLQWAANALEKVESSILAKLFPPISGIILNHAISEFKSSVKCAPTDPHAAQAKMGNAALVFGVGLMVKKWESDAAKSKPESDPAMDPAVVQQYQDVRAVVLAEVDRIKASISGKAALCVSIARCLSSALPDTSGLDCHSMITTVRNLRCNAACLEDEACTNARVASQALFQRELEKSWTGNVASWSDNPISALIAQVTASLEVLQRQLPDQLKNA